MSRTRATTMMLSTNAMLDKSIRHCPFYYVDGIVTPHDNRRLSIHLCVVFATFTHFNMAADSATRTECVAASVNIALGRSAFQSSEYSVETIRADLAIDGNEDGTWSLTTCTATAHNCAPNAWWAVDLASKIFVFQIQIANRVTYCELLLNNISVYLCAVAY